VTVHLCLYGGLMIPKLIFILMMGVIAFGCSKEQRKPGVYVEKDAPLTFQEMSGADVFVRINGISLTKSLFSTFCSLQEKIYRLHHAIALNRVSEKADAYRRRNEQRWYEELIRRELMRQEADRCAVQAPTGAVVKAEKRMLGFLRQGEKNFSDLTNHFDGAEFTLLRRHVLEDVRSDALRRMFATNAFETVTDAEIDECIANVKAFNVRADRLNEKSRKKGLQFKADVLAGKAKFPALTKTCAEVHPEYGAKWDDVQLGEFPEDSPLRQWLKKARPGDISDPIDLDDGLAVIGFVAKLEADVPKGMPPLDLYRLVRCTFRAYEKMAEKPRDEVRRILLKEKKDAVQRELGSRIFDSAVIEYPHGTDLFPSVKAERAPQASDVVRTNEVSHIEKQR